MEKKTHRFFELQVGKTYALSNADIAQRNALGQQIDILRCGNNFQVIGKAIGSSYAKNERDYGRRKFEGVWYAVQVFHGYRGMLCFDDRIPMHAGLLFVEV